MKLSEIITENFLTTSIAMRNNLAWQAAQPRQRPNRQPLPEDELKEILRTIRSEPPMTIEEAWRYFLSKCGFKYIYPFADEYDFYRKTKDIVLERQYHFPTTKLIDKQSAFRAGIGDNKSFGGINKKSYR